VNRGYCQTVTEVSEEFVVSNIRVEQRQTFNAFWNSLILTMDVECHFETPVIVIILHNIASRTLEPL